MTHFSFNGLFQARKSWLRVVICLTAAVSTLMLVAPTAEASLLSRFSAAGSADFLMEDTSRELLIDVNGNNRLDGEDVLIGFLRIEQTSPPINPVNNTLYAVFSQQFDVSSFLATPTTSGTRYSGTFQSTDAATGYDLDSLLPTLSGGVGGFSSGAMIALIELAAPLDLITADFSVIGGVEGAIAMLDALGTVRFTVGLDQADDFFAFQTPSVGGTTGVPDFPADISEIDNILTSQSLGAFAAGLSVTDNYMPLVQFNRVIQTFFENDGGAFGGAGTLYDLALLNGNFGGIREGTGGPLINNADSGQVSFINNADAVVNVTVIPEPGTLAIWGLLGGLGGLAASRRRRNNS